MKLIKREQLEMEHLPGRAIQKAVGKDGLSASHKMTMGFARYSEESGPMEPHRHAEEIVYVIGSDSGWFSRGCEKDGMGEKIPLETGMILHFEELEWHVFGFGKDGFVDIIFFYGQVDNIRPEEILKKQSEL